MLLGSAFPALAVAADDPVLAESMAAPLRERLLERMESWRKVLFPDGAAGRVAQRHGARYDALEAAVRGQRHPGDIHRSRYAFEELLHDALRERHREDKRARLTAADFKEYRADKAALVESAAAEAASRGRQNRAELAAVSIVPPAGILPDAAETRLPSVLFDGAALGRMEAVSAPPAAIPLLPSRALAPNWTLGLPISISAPAVVEAARAVGPARFAKVRAILIAQGASPEIVDLGIERAVEEDFDPILLLALSQQESHFDPKAKSKAGARGLMQIMPATAGDYGVTDPDQLYDPATNYRVGLQHFKRLCKMFSGAGTCGEGEFDPKQRGAIVATASWNAGEGNVLKHKGVPPFEETRDFVQKVLGYYETFKTALAR